MKTVISKQHFFNNTTPLLQWKRLGLFLRAAIRGSELWQLDQLWHGMFLQVRILLAHAAKEAFAGLTALVLSSTANYRIFAGLVFVGIVTPLASCAYQLFDFNERIAGWYHLNNFHLFMLLGPYLSGLALTIGLFLLFPNGVKRSFTLIIPGAYFIGKLIWLYQTSSNEEYWSVPSWSFFAVGFVISTVLFISIEWLAHRKFHGQDRYTSRIKGLVQIADDVPADKWKSMMLTVLKEEAEFKKSF